MNAPPPKPDPVDVAAAYPNPPGRRQPGVTAEVPGQGAVIEPELVARLDGVPVSPVEVVLAAEQLAVGTEWTVSGTVRFRRRIVTYTSTVEVTMRREEMHVEVWDVTDHDGAWVGISHHGPAAPPPPVVTGPGVFVLREEVPDVVLTVRPYERVVVHIDRVTEQVTVDGAVRREQAVVSGATGTAHPPRRPDEPA